MTQVAREISLIHLDQMAAYFAQPQRSAPAKAFATRCARCARLCRERGHTSTIVWLDPIERPFVTFYLGGEQAIAEPVTAA